MTISTEKVLLRFLILLMKKIGETCSLSTCFFFDWYKRCDVQHQITVNKDLHNHDVAFFLHELMYFAIYIFPSYFEQCQRHCFYHDIKIYFMKPLMEIMHLWENSSTIRLLSK